MKITENKDQYHEDCRNHNGRGQQREMSHSAVMPLLLWGGLFTSAIALGLLSPLERFPWLACILFAPLAYKLQHDNRILKGLLTGWIFGTLCWAAGTWWMLNGMDSLLAWSPGQSRTAGVLIWLYQGAPFAVLGGICGWMNQRGHWAGPLFCASLLTLLVFIRPPLFPVSSVVAVTLWPSFIQIADLGGEHFVFFVLMLINWLIADCFSRSRRRDPTPLWIRLAMPTILLGTVLGYGTFQIHQISKAAQITGEGLVVASVQPDVPVRWDSLENFATDQSLCLKTLKAYPNHIQNAELIIFPEMPGFQYGSGQFRDSDLGNALQDLAVPVLLPSDEYILDPEALPIKMTTDKRMIIKQKIQQKFSSVFAMSPGGDFSLAYRKVRLVPFSETTPLGTWFPWLKKALGQNLEFSPGEGPGLIEIGHLSVQPLICFESGFPGLVRQGVALGANLLAEVSNDGWFSSTDAEMKHLSMGIFRTVEFRRPLVRCSNSGGGAHVTATGHIVPGTLTPHGRALVTRAKMVSPDTLTLFARWGNAWLWGAMLIVFWRITATLAGLTWGKDDNKVGSAVGLFFR